jgi:ElaB/YqjD/DUF883 family membrane-anchored ribosome-binding protein
MLFRKRNSTDVRKSLSACRDDLAALQRDARELATGVSEVTRNGATRAAKQANDAYGYVSKQIANRPRLSTQAVATVARQQRFSIIAAFAGFGAIIGALLTSRR